MLIDNVSLRYLEVREQREVDVCDMRLGLDVSPFLYICQRDFRTDVVVSIASESTVRDDIIIVGDVVPLHAREELMRCPLTLHEDRAADFSAAVERDRIEVICLYIVNGNRTVRHIRFEHDSAQCTGVFGVNLYLRHDAVEYFLDEARPRRYVVNLFLIAFAVRIGNSRLHFKRYQRGDFAGDRGRQADALLMFLKPGRFIGIQVRPSVNGCCHLVRDERRCQL